MIKTAFKKIIPFHLRYYIRQVLFPATVNENIPLRKEFYSYFIKEGDWVFDVGANMGNRVKAFLDLKAKVVAVEPQKSCYKYLKLMYGKKIQLITKGLGAKEETKVFYIADSSTISTFSEDYIKAVKTSGRFGNNTWNKTEEIEMTTLDKLIQIYGVPAFIKIDVEGFEKEVLSGLTKKINALSFEYCVPEQLSQAIGCIKILAVSNPSMKFNFSTGESMKLESSNWLPAAEMLSFMNSDNFISTGFGDIYGKNFI
jgi:FkbM family methyltransferase